MEKKWRPADSNKNGNSKSFSSSRNKTSSEISSINKKAQVYSRYIESDHKQLNSDDIKIKKNDLVKKPRLNEIITPMEEENVFKATLNETDFSNVSTDNFNYDLMKAFIGLNQLNCENVFIGFIDQEFILINLDEKSKFKKNNFCFKGKCSISLIYGEIEINGHILKHYLNENTCKKDWYDVYSPETNSFVSLFNKAKLNSRSNENGLNINSILDRIKTVCNLNIDSKSEENLEKFLKENEFSAESSSLLAIKPLRSQICNYLSYFENFQYVYQSASQLHSDNINSIQNDVENKFINIGIHPVSSDHFNAIHIISNEEKEFAETLNKYEDESLVIMAAGGKDVGKSTFLRYTVNSLLNNYSKVAYLDCDPGQCEFTLSTCISLSLITDPLLGPPHTHIAHSNSNKMCYFLGHLSPNDVPGHYMRCLRSCYDDFLEYRSKSNKSEKIPLIINTMGWNQGLGLCLLKESILLFKPTILVQLNHPTEANKNMPLLDKNWLLTTDGWPPSFNKASNKALINKNNRSDGNSNLSKSLSSNECFESMDIDPVSDLYSAINYNLVILKSGAPFKSNKFQIKSPQKRFSARDHRNIAIIAYFSSLFDPRSFFTPINYLRPYKIAWSKITLHVNHSKIDYDQLLRVFNASLVGLCQIDPKYIKRKEENLDLPGYLSTTYDQEKQIPIVYKCFGFGIIRGINTETKEFYILTPESIETLNNVNLFTKGMLNLPLEFFYEQDSETPCPYVSFSDNIQPKNNEQLKAISNEPATRKYLIHQNMSQKQQQQQQ